LRTFADSPAANVGQLIAARKKYPRERPTPDRFGLKRGDPAANSNF
jgi:hypothetical protein